MQNATRNRDLEERTTVFAVAVITYVSKLPKTSAADVIGRQLLRSATSIGANYREANRAESRDDFVHKTGIAQKEASETEYWLDICQRTSTDPSEALPSLLQESRELLAIFTTINRKAKGR